MQHIVISFLLLPLTFAAALLQAQTPRAITLGRPDAELTQTFSAVTSVRELTDRRVIVSDSRDRTVQLVDFRRQTATKIGREGAGPGEYGFPGRLFPARGDTTWLLDGANSRLLMIAPDGKAGATRPYDVGPFTSRGTLVGIDELGRLYVYVRSDGKNVEGGQQTLVRYTPSTKRIDSITTLHKPDGLQTGSKTLGGGMLKVFTNLPFAQEDAAIATKEGRVAVARSNPYRVVWYSPSMQRTEGRAVAYAPVSITDAEKKAFMESSVRPGAIVVRNSGGQAMQANSASTPVQLRSPDLYDDAGMTWPARKPPFVGAALSVDGRGRLWVLRTAPHTAKALVYDVFDAAAQPVLSVTLPPKSRVAGFGANSVYVAFTDEDDLQRLQRFPLPEADTTRKK